MVLKYISVVLICSSLILNGCASTAHFNNTPVEESEFYKDLDYLRAKYSDIDEYDRTIASPKSAPTKNELDEMWGEPKTEKYWGAHLFFSALAAWNVAMGYPLFLLVFVGTPTPSENYVWEKGDYSISATGRNDLMVGYEKRIHSWEWKKNDASIKYAEDVKLSGEFTSK